MFTVTIKRTSGRSTVHIVSQDLLAAELRTLHAEIAQGTVKHFRIV